MVQNLQPDTEYDFQVLAANAVTYLRGASLPSPMMTTRTLPGEYDTYALPSPMMTTRTLPGEQSDLNPARLLLIILEKTLYQAPTVVQIDNIDLPGEQLRQGCFNKDIILIKICAALCT